MLQKFSAFLLINILSLGLLYVFSPAEALYFRRWSSTSISHRSLNYNALKAGGDINCGPKG